MKKGKKKRWWTVSFSTEISVEASSEKEAEEKLREEIEENLGSHAEQYLMDIEIDEEKR